MLSSSGTVWPAQTLLSSDTTASSEGYFVLSWLSDGTDAGAPPQDTAASYILQQATRPDFADASTRLIHGQNSVTISGLENGSYFYRIQPEGDDWSNSLSVQVQHHSLRKALGFFSLGLLLFITLCVSIFAGIRLNLPSHPER
ncbi:MAG: hypothetical protein RQ899_00560 [Pseudomonadales bacterium]|nr:hypothetical protein [Pseudomonadales bacterium]